MPTRRIPAADGEAAVREVLGGERTRATLALAVRWLLQEIAAAHPGHSVELRVPPFGAVQIVEGPRHTRGTPPAVVEIPPLAWVRLATGGYSWADACTDGDIQASGVRSDLSALLPVVAFRPAPKSALDEGTADADGPGTLLS